LRRARAAPVAAAICDGVALAALGERVEPASLVVLELGEAHRDGSVLRARVLSIDGFGNVELDADTAAIAGRSALVVAGSAVPLVGTFGEVPSGELLAYIDSRGALALAVNRGSAATRLGLRVGDEVPLGEPA
jgi:S-adenosylmethionine hydrolase